MRVVGAACVPTTTVHRPWLLTYYKNGVHFSMNGALVLHTAVAPPCGQEEDVPPHCDRNCSPEEFNLCVSLFQDRATFRRLIVKNNAKKRKMYECFIESVPLLKSLEVSGSSSAWRPAITLLLSFTSMSLYIHFISSFYDNIKHTKGHNPLSNISFVFLPHGESS